MRSLLPLVLVAACASEPTPAPAPTPAVEPAAEAGPQTRNPDWVAERVETAHAHLASTEGGQLLRQAIDAHGGLAAWFSPGSITFDFKYVAAGSPDTPRWTRNVADTWGGRVHQTALGEGADATFAWDGSTTWIRPSEEAFPSPAFWATTPYYFVAIPWVLADPGTVHTVEGEQTLTHPETGDSIDTVAVRVTYESGTGEAPDDFYIAHMDPQTHQLLALRYIVTSPVLFPDGRPDAPQTVLFYSQHEPTEDGLVIPRHYDGYHWRDGAPADRKSTVTVSNIATGPVLPDSTFAEPE